MFINSILLLSIKVTNTSSESKNVEYNNQNQHNRLTQHSRCSVFIINLLTLGTENQNCQNDVTDIRIEINRMKITYLVPKDLGLTQYHHSRVVWLKIEIYLKR